MFGIAWLSFMSSSSTLFHLGWPAIIWLATV